MVHSLMIPTPSSVILTVKISDEMETSDFAVSSEYFNFNWRAIDSIRSTVYDVLWTTIQGNGC